MLHGRLREALARREARALRAVLALRAALGRPAWRYSLYYSVLFLLFGVYWPYFPTWLEAQGLRADTIGYLLTMLFWARFLAGPAYALATSKVADQRAPLLAVALVALAAFALFLVVDSVWLLFLVMAASSGAIHTVLPLGETQVLRAARRGDFVYGRVRLWGSAAFILANIGGGALLGLFGPGMVMVWILIAGLALVAVIRMLPEPAFGPAPGGARRTTLAELGRLLATPACALFMLGASAAQASHAIYYGYSVIAWRAQGIPPTLAGVLWGIAVLAEIVLFATAHKILGRRGAAGLLLIGAAGGTLRWLLMALTPPLWALFLIQLLHGLSFGAVHLAAMSFLTHAVPARLATTAQSFYSATSMGGMTGLAMLLGAAIYAGSPALSYVAMAGLAAAGVAAGLLLPRLWPGGLLLPPDPDERPVALPVEMR